MEEDKFIELCNLLKIKWGVLTGGQAKVIIRSGVVKVNGVVETRNKKKIRPGDIVEYDGQVVKVS